MRQAIKWVFLLDIVLVFLAIGIWLNNNISGKVLLPVSFLVIVTADVLYVRHRLGSIALSPAEKSRKAWGLLAFIFGCSAVGGFINFFRFYTSGKAPLMFVTIVTVPIVMAVVFYRQYSRTKNPQADRYR